MNMNDETVKLQVKAHMQYGLSIPEISEELSLPINDTEELVFELCRLYPDECSIDRYLTKEWLSEKIKTNTIMAIANITRQKFRRIQYLLSKYNISVKREPSTELPDRDTLYAMYITRRMSDGKIAKQYGVPVYIIKNLRYRLGILKTERTPIEDILTREFFHRLYVEFGICIVKIAALLDTNRVLITELKDKYATANDEISKSVRSQTNNKSNNALFDKLLTEVPRNDLIKRLHTESLLEIAVEYGLVAGSRELIPYTKEWFLMELQEKSPTKISIEAGKPYREICDMLDAFGIDHNKRKNEIDPNMLKYLFEHLMWSDTEIAAMFGISKTAISKQRSALGITAQSRLSLEERIPPAVFIALYLKERMNTVQMGKAFRTSAINISNLKHKYIADGYTELENARSTGVSKPRFDYLTRQIELGIYKY